MIIYGVKVQSDIPFQTHLFDDGDYKYTFNLSSVILHNTPLYTSQFTCGTHLHTIHKHKIFLYRNHDIAEGVTKKEPLCYEVEDKVRFYWYHGSVEIFYEILDSSQKEFEFWFIHTFFSFFLSLEKYFVLLHGSAVLIEGKAILFLAPYKSGKSTLTYYMTQQHDHQLITDDILPTFIEKNKLVAVPSHPHSHPDRGLFDLGYPISQTTNRFHVLSAIYILENSDYLKTTISEIKGIQKFIMAKKNSVIYTLPHIRLTHERYFGRILNTLPVFHIKRPWGKMYIPQTYQTLIAHIRSNVL